MAEIVISTQKKRELVNITPLIQKEVKRHNFKEGLVYLFLPHATAGFWLNEDEEGLKKDVLRFLDGLTKGNSWQHNQIDNNAEAHLAAGILKPSLTLAVKNGGLTLGAWQQVFLVELDGPRERTVRLVFIKEYPPAFTGG